MEETFNPWLSIWIKPRATIRRIIEENPNRSLWFLATIYGFVSLSNNAQTLGLGRSFNLIAVFLLVLALAPLWGYLFFSIWSAIVYGICKLFKGQASFKAVRAAYAWSCVPFILNAVLWGILAFVFGNQLFMLNMMGSTPSDNLILFMFFVLIARLTLAVWSLVIYFNTLAEVQAYSVLKAILNVVTAAIAMACISLLFWNLWMYILEPSQPMVKMGFLLISGMR